MVLKTPFTLGWINMDFTYSIERQPLSHEFGGQWFVRVNCVLFLYPDLTLRLWVSEGEISGHFEQQGDAIQLIQRFKKYLGTKENNE